MYTAHLKPPYPRVDSPVIGGLNHRSLRHVQRTGSIAQGPGQANRFGVDNRSIAVAVRDGHRKRIRPSLPVHPEAASVIHLECIAIRARAQAELGAHDLCSPSWIAHRALNRNLARAWRIDRGPGDGLLRR